MRKPRTTCKHILTAQHRVMLKAIGKDGTHAIKSAMSIAYTEAGKGMRHITQGLLEYVSDLVQDVEYKGSLLISRDDEGHISKEGWNEIASFLVTLQMVLQSRNPEGLKLLDADSRMKSHRSALLLKNPVTPGTKRNLVSGRITLTLDDLGSKSRRGLKHAAKCSCCYVNGGALLRAKEALKDDRIVRKLSAVMVKDHGSVKLSYYDQLMAAITAVEIVVAKTGLDPNDIKVAFDVFVDRDGRVYFGGSLTQQSAKWIQVLTRLPKAADMTNTATKEEVCLFWRSEFKLDFNNRDVIKGITSQSIADWFVGGGCPKVYEHAMCAQASWDTNEYYLPVEFDMVQSVGTLCALLVGHAGSMESAGLIPDSDGVYHSAWESQEDAMSKFAPGNLFEALGLDAAQRKAGKKGVVTINSYQAGIPTCVQAFLSLPEAWKKADDMPKGLTLASFLSGLTSDKGREHAQMIIDASKKGDTCISTPSKLVEDAVIFIEDIQLSINTSMSATAILQEFFAEIAVTALEKGLPQQWVDVVDFPGRASGIKVNDDKALPKTRRNKIYGTPCFPPCDEEGNVLTEEWFEENRRRKSLRFLPVTANTSPKSFMPCFVQGALESAFLKLMYAMLSLLLRYVFCSSRHDCVICSPEDAAKIRKIAHRCLYIVARDTDLMKMFAHLDPPSSVNVQRWASDGTVIKDAMDVVDPDRDANLAVAKESMRPFEV